MAEQIEIILSADASDVTAELQKEFKEISNCIKKSYKCWRDKLSN